MKIKGEANMNLGRILPMNEAKMTKRQFLEFLKDSARLDPKNFKLGNAVVEGLLGPENWSVVVGEHALKRLRQRTFMSPETIVSKAIAVLSMPLVGTEVVKHQVFWDDELGKAVEFDGDGIKATAVVLEAENLVFVFEAGGNYINLVTIWSGNVFEKRMRDCEVVFLGKNGTISFYDYVSAMR